MANLTTVARLRPAIDEADATDARLAFAIEGASAMIIAEAEAFSLGWDADVVPSTVPAEVEFVCLRAARREVLNPEELNREQGGDILNGTPSRNAVGFFLTPDERRKVRMAAQREDGRPRGVSTLRMSAPVNVENSGYIGWDGSAWPFPWTYTP